MEASSLVHTNVHAPLSTGGGGGDDDSTRIRPVKRTYGRRREIAAVEDGGASGQESAKDRAAAAAAAAATAMDFDTLYAAHNSTDAVVDNIPSSNLSWTGLEATETSSSRADNNGQLLARWQTGLTDFRSAVSLIPSPSKAKAGGGASRTTTTRSGPPTSDDRAASSSSPPPPRHRLLAGTKLGESDWRAKLARGVADDDDDDDEDDDEQDKAMATADATRLRRLAQEEIARKVAPAVIPTEPSSDLTSLATTTTSSDPAMTDDLPSSLSSSSAAIVRTTAGNSHHKRRVVESSSSIVAAAAAAGGDVSGPAALSSLTEGDESDAGSESGSGSGLGSGLMPTQESPSVMTQTALRRRRRPTMISSSDDDEEQRGFDAEGNGSGDPFATTISDNDDDDDLRTPQQRHGDSSSTHHSSSSLTGGGGLDGIARRAEMIAARNRTRRDEERRQEEDSSTMELDAFLKEHEELQRNVTTQQRGLSKKAQLEMEKTQAEIRASKRVNLPRMHTEFSMAAYAAETQEKLEKLERTAKKRPITSVAPGLVPIRDKKARSTAVTEDDERERTPPASTSDDLIADFSSERTQCKTTVHPSTTLPSGNVAGQLSFVPAYDDEDQDTPVAKRRRHKGPAVAESDSDDESTGGGLAALVQADDKRREAEEVQRRKAALALRKQQALAAASSSNSSSGRRSADDDGLELIDDPSRKLPMRAALQPHVGPKEALEGRANQGKFTVEQKLAAIRGNVKRSRDAITDSLIDVAKHSTFDDLIQPRTKGGKVVPAKVAQEDLDAQLIREAKVKAQAAQAKKEKEFRYHGRVLNPKRPVDLQALVQDLGPADDPEVSASEHASDNDDDSEDEDYRPDELMANAGEVVEHQEETPLIEPITSTSRPRKNKVRVTDSDDDEAAVTVKARMVDSEDDEVVAPAASVPVAAAEPFVEAAADDFGFDDDGGFSQLFGATAAPAATAGFGALRHDAPLELESRAALPTAAVSASAQARNEAILAAEMMPQYEPTQQTQAVEQRWLGPDGFFTQTKPATQAMARTRTEDSLPDRSGSASDPQLEPTWQTPTEQGSTVENGSPTPAFSRTHRASYAESSDVAAPNAFDKLMAAKPHVKAARAPAMASEELRGFIEDAAEESDEDGGFMWQRRGDDDDEEDADGDGVVEGLVDDQERTAEQIREDELKAMAKLREIEADDDLERQRIAQDAVDGKMRTRRRDGTMRDLDFDSDDEERLRMKRPRRRRDRKRNLGGDDELDRLDGESLPFAQLYRDDLMGSDDDEDEPMEQEPVLGAVASRSPTPEAPKTISAYEFRQRVREMGDEKRQREFMSSPEPMTRQAYGSDTEEDEPQSLFSMTRETSRSLSRQSAASKDDLSKYERYLKNTAVQQSDTNRTGKNMSVTGGGGGGSRSSLRALSDPSKKQNTTAKAASNHRSLSNVLHKRSGFQ